MLCPWCNTHNRENAKFCKGCGQVLAVETVAGAETRQSAPPPATEQSQPQVKEPTPGVSAMSPSAPPPPPPPGSENIPTLLATPAPYPTAENPSETPTEALTPEQLAEHRRRRGSSAPIFSPQFIKPGQNNPYDISDAPTILAPLQSGPTPVPGNASDPTIYAPVPQHPANEPTIYASTPFTSESAIEATVYAGPDQSQQDIADMPTILIPQEQIANTTPEEVSTLEVEQDQTPVSEEAEPPSQQAQEDDASPDSPTRQPEAQGPETPSASPETLPEEPPSKETEEEVPADKPLSEEEKSVESETETDITTEELKETFPVLTVGTVIAERYQISQVLETAENEHVYEVVDQQGYRYCWNCESKENAEGDDFCIDCGAGLLNAGYRMREFPGKESSETVLSNSIIDTLVENEHTYVIERPETLQNASPNGVHLLASCGSDVGVARQGGANEDSTLILQLERVHESIASPAGIFLVADGMGGHANGQLASRMTSGLIAERFVREMLQPPLVTEKEKEGEQSAALDEEGLLNILHGAIQDANNAICQINSRDKSDMGTTLTGFMIVGEHAYIFNVGDSRTYMLRDSKLYQITNDHSLVGQLLAGGLIEPEDVYTHPQRSQIYRSIGDKVNVQIDVFKQQIQPGDILLSCSDGLWEMVRDPKITDILNDAPDPQTACVRLIESANANGGDDNVSTTVVFVR